jgi:hypothetical protein
METYFQENGYTLLEWVKGANSKQKVRHDECKHEYPVTYAKFKDCGRRCPRCSSYRSEKLCTTIFESFFPEKEFRKQRPKFLNGLELDGYNEELNIAFEYNGVQHYKYNSHFHRTKDVFEQQLERDQRKYAICAKKNIKLCIIPYKFSYKNEKELKTFVKDWLIANEINF